ncbi:MAG: hypothetical protein ACIAQZ_11000 [Sedimentisphaeraceae bacterium JB056]
MLKNVTLEMSLKPFLRTEDEYVEGVCRELFSQWKSLTDNANIVSVLLWTADGSELLDYRGNLDAEIEWAKYIGGANPKGNVVRDPDGKCLHSTFYLYTEKPATITYCDLKRIVESIKRVGSNLLGKQVRVGTTFDPGPEFAKSPFKYERHPEICIADSIGKGQNKFVACVSTLKADNVSYAGFPDGIAEGTHIGTFLGRQSQCFMDDMGFDYIWLSNGFGFGTETWQVPGLLFDGEFFDSEKAAELRERVVAFWHNFRRECPNYLIETRGTNLTTGVDLSTDAVDLKGIYNGGFNMTTPPNSPWAAIDGDFGLELAGYMSHIAEVPKDNPYFVFRFYVHDPWWLNSPWIDRYGKNYHDIYMPLAVSRIDNNGDTETAAAVELLTVDDSYGRMPIECPLEITPHFNEGLKNAPDAAGPLVWLYPFDQYHDQTFGDDPQLEEVFFGDWFIRDVINDSVPLNTVVSSFGFSDVCKRAPEKLSGSVIVTPLPSEGAEVVDSLVKFIVDRGNVLFYGPARNADQRILDLLGIELESSISGELSLDWSLKGSDELASSPKSLMHEELASGGGCCGVSKRTQILASVSDGRQTRAYAVNCTAGKGTAAWIRGSNSGSYVKDCHLLKEYDRQKYADASLLFRQMLAIFGYEFNVDKQNRLQRSPSFCISRNKGAFYFSGYSRNTTAGVSWKMPQGAPILIGLETLLSGGCSHYRFPRAWRYECRVFVEQADESEISCKEQISGEVGVSRRISVDGLKNATLRFYCPPESGDKVRVLHQPQWPFITGDWLEYEYDPIQECCILRNVTGSLQIVW